MYLVTFNKHISYNIFLLMKKSPMPLEIYKKSHKLILSDRTGRKTLIKKKTTEKVNICKTWPTILFY
jgi:hypothetical protein